MNNKYFLSLALLLLALIMNSQDNSFQELRVINSLSLEDNTTTYAQRIKSSAVLPIGHDVLFLATKEIVLSNGFRSVPGSNFSARIELADDHLSYDVNRSKKIVLVPNPSDNYTTVYLTQDIINSDASIEVMDISGRIVISIRNIKSDELKNGYLLNTSNLISGHYIISLSYDSRPFESVLLNRL